MFDERLTVPNKAQQAFTLVELLAVAAVIAILAVLLFPAAERGLGTAKTARCQSQLRQIGMGVMFFVQDNAGMMPPKDENAGNPAGRHNQFSDWIAPYIQAKSSRRSVWKCPADRRMKNQYGQEITCSYGLNINSIPSEYGNLLPYPYSAVTLRSAVIMLADTTGWGSGSDRELYWGPVGGVNTVNMEFRHPRSRVSEVAWPNPPPPTQADLADAMANVLFYDGHTATRTYASLTRTNFFGR